MHSVHSTRVVFYELVCIICYYTHVCVLVRRKYHTPYAALAQFLKDEANS